MEGQVSLERCDQKMGLRKARDGGAVNLVPAECAVSLCSSMHRNADASHVRQSLDAHAPDYVGCLNILDYAHVVMHEVREANDHDSSHGGVLTFPAGIDLDWSRLRE